MLPDRVREALGIETVRRVSHLVGCGTRTQVESPAACGMVRSKGQADWFKPQARHGVYSGNFGAMPVLFLTMCHVRVPARATFAQRVLYVSPDQLPPQNQRVCVCLMQTPGPAVVRSTDTNFAG